MANTYGLTRRLISAVNRLYNCHIVLNISSFFNNREGPNNQVNMYILKEEYHFPDGERVNRELFRSASSVYTCLYMRDLLYVLQDKEIPDDNNEGWENMKIKRNVAESIAYIKEKYGKL